MLSIILFCILFSFHHFDPVDIRIYYSYYVFNMLNIQHDLKKSSKINIETSNLTVKHMKYVLFKETVKEKNNIILGQMIFKNIKKIVHCLFRHKVLKKPNTVFYSVLYLPFLYLINCLLY